jgi:hypothetical protein
MVCRLWQERQRELVLQDWQPRKTRTSSARKATTTTSLPIGLRPKRAVGATNKCLMNKIGRPAIKSVLGENLNEDDTTEASMTVGKQIKHCARIQ